jgi:PEP-CTERM motif
MEVWIMKKMLSGIAIVLACAGTSQAAELINQDWEDTGTYFPGVTGFLGDAATVGGRWLPFDEFDVIGISNTVANGGSQSAIVTRGGALVGRVDEIVSTPDFEVSYSMFRDSADSECMVQVGNSSSINSAVDLASFIRANGQIYIWAGGWVATPAIVPVGAWTDVRLAVDANAMTYDLFMGPAGGAEAFIQTVSLTALPVNINALRMNPQGLAGTVTYYDDLLLSDSSAGAIEGDLNGDGFVGIADLNLVLGNWNLNVPPADPLADPSGDEFIGIADLNTVLGNWNAGTPPAAATVPEPATLALVGLGVLSLARRGHRG